MKTRVQLLIIIMLLISCGSDKKSQLVKLQTQRDKINRKIEQLEKELGADTAIVNSNYKLVAVTPVELKPFKHYIEVQGKLDGDESVSVSPKINSTVVKLNVNIGDRVKKGQVLAVLDEKSTGQSLDVLKTNLALATDMYERQKRLYDQKIGSEVQYLDIKNKKETLEQSIATVEDLMTVKSPIDGTVEEVNTKIGQFVTPQFPVFRVVSFKKLKVTAEVAEGYSSQIRQGDVVAIDFPDIQTELSATITSASGYINPTNRTFTVEAAISPTNKPLKANMVAVLKINDYKNPDCISIPVNLIQNDLNGSYVMIAQVNKNDTIAKKVPIKTGVIYNGIAEITSGLKYGDKLISAGYQDIEEGESLKY